jgi:hypothetical protein
MSTDTVFDDPKRPRLISSSILSKTEQFVQNKGNMALMLFPWYPRAYAKSTVRADARRMNSEFP